MAWYVFALLDAVPRASPGRGLSAPISFRRSADVFAAVERRADVPPIELGALRAHQQIVERIASKARAILPVRFGTLLTTDEIDESLSEWEPELEEAFDLVRGRQQMTWRVRKSRRAEQVFATASREKSRAMSGVEYLQKASRATNPPSSGVLRRIEDSIGHLVVAKRYQQESAALPDALYHLIDRTQLTAYREASSRLVTSTSSVTLSGPWAPYAFVPEIF
jgi:Gas vesicle synthesis protein GvpL/GvpF